MTSFTEVLNTAILGSNKSLGKIIRELKQKGYTLNKSTLSRWLSGATQPDVKQLGVLRCLPEILGMSLDEQSVFYRSLNHWLEVKGGMPGSAPLAYRQHTLGQSQFFGRAYELQELQQIVVHHRSVAITGLGGVGKTTLAQQLLQTTAQHFASGCEAIVLRPGQPVAEVMVQVAHRLGLELSSAVQSASEADLLAWVASRAIGVELLFLLDDVSHETQIKDLMQHLPSITWVITSRRPIANPQVTRFPLGVPPTAEAAQLLLKQIGLNANATEIQLAHSIADRLGNLPLAMSCAAGLSHVLKADLATLLQHLSRDGLEALRLDYAHLPRFFAAMLSGRSPAEQTLFEVCGAFALPRIAVRIFQSVANSLQVHPAGLLVLSDLSLISWPESTEHLSLHPLVHEYARLRLQQATRLSDIQQHFCQHYAELAQHWRHSANEEDLINELENILQAADYAYELQDWVCFRRFWSPITHRLWLNGDKQRYVAYDLRFLEAARLQGDRSNEAQILAELGWVQIEWGDLAAADQWLQASLALCESLPDSAFQRARVLRYLAKVAIKRRNSSQAMVLLQEAEAILQIITPVTERMNLARSLIYLARAKLAYSSNEFELARSAAYTSLEYCQQAGASGQGYLPGICVDVGDLLFEHDQLAAEHLWQQAADIKPELAEDTGVATALARLAYLAARRGEHSMALAYAHSAHDLYLKRGLLRYQQQLTNWLLHYESDKTVDPLLSLARLED